MSQNQHERSDEENPVKVIIQSAALIGGISLFLGLIFYCVASLLHYEKPLTPAEQAEKRKIEAENLKIRAEQIEAAKEKTAYAVKIMAGSLLVFGYVGVIFGTSAFITRDATNRGHNGEAWCAIFLGIQFILRPFVYLAARGVANEFKVEFGYGIALTVTLACVDVFAWSGLFVYLYARRRGELEKCPECLQPRLHYLLTCPHCGRK
jgi:heme/copper-type cytochrome/quinol oxidase subunit 2